MKNVKCFSVMKLKACLLGGVIILGMSTAIGQTPVDTLPSPIKKNVLNKSSASTLFAPPSGFFPSVIPPSPEAASLGKFVEWPVSLATGTPSINIPLYSFSKGDISVPIGLSYHGSGIKMDEIANWTGLGWTLNAGGAVTRTVRGRPDDDKDKGFLDYKFDKSYASFNSGYYYDISDGCLEAQPDIFNLNVNGITAQFVFDWNNQGLKVSSERKLLVNYSRDAITRKITTWTVTDDMGLIYSFREVETSNNAGPGVTGCSFFNNYNIAWYLSDIKDMNNDHKINFIYESYGLKTQNISHTYRYGQNTNLGCGGANTLSTSYSNNSVNGKRIKEILTDDGTIKVTFIPSVGDRLDKGGLTSDAAAPSNFKYLAELQVTDMFNKNVKSFKFGYENLATSRLMLLSIQPLENNINASPPYILDYNGRLPAVGGTERFDQDYWGYYNGAINNHLVPTYPGVPFWFLEQNGDVSREPVEEFTKKAILTKIKYPTGGSAVFEFEANAYQITPAGALPTIKIAGGVRIKTQKMYTIDGVSLSNQFKYTYLKPDNSSSGVLMNDLNYSYDIEVWCNVDNTAEASTTQHVRGSNSISGFGANHIAYSEAQTLFENGTNNNGKSNFVFTVASPIAISGPPLAASFANHYSTGQLLNQKDYSFNNTTANYSLVHELTNTYTNYESQVPVFAATFLGGFYSPATISSHFLSATYNTVLGFSRLNSTIENMVFTAGNAVSTKNIVYTSSGQYITKEIQSTSKANEQLVNEYYYPFDFTNAASTTISDLVTKNKIGSPIEIVTKKVINGVDKIIGAYYTKYAILDSKLRVEKKYKLATINGLTNAQFTLSSTALGGFNDIINYNEELFISKYDIRGNILEYKARSKPITSYVWGYNNSMPICEAINVTNAQLITAMSSAGIDANLMSVVDLNAAQKAQIVTFQNSLFASNLSLTNWMSYDPLIGMKAVISQNGLETTYKYDLQNRLKELRDPQDKIVKSYTYGYNQP